MLISQNIHFFGTCLHLLYNHLLIRHFSTYHPRCASQPNSSPPPSPTSTPSKSASSTSEVSFPPPPSPSSPKRADTPHELVDLQNTLLRSQDPRHREPGRRRPRPRSHRLHRQRHPSARELPAMPAPAHAVVGAESGRDAADEFGEESAGAAYVGVDGECGAGVE